MTRTVSRYLDTISYTREDYTNYGAAYDLGTGTYTTYAWFDDTEPNIYPYSFCNIDEDYFTAAQVHSHEENPDSTEKLNTDCTLYEHLEANFPMCKVNYGGFISDSTKN